MKTRTLGNSGLEVSAIGLGCMGLNFGYATSVSKEDGIKLIRDAAELRHALARYGELLSHRRLLGYAGAGGFFYGGMFAYIAATPFAYITYFHVPPQFYGLLFGVGIIGSMAANFANARLVTRLGGDRLLPGGTGAAALGGIVLVATSLTGRGGLVGLVLPLFLFISATGFIVANSISGALADFPEQAGAVSALVGAIQYGSGILGSVLVGAFADGTPRPMAWVIALAGTGSLFCARLLVRAGALGSPSGSTHYT